MDRRAVADEGPPDAGEEHAPHGLALGHHRRIVTPQGVELDQRLGGLAQLAMGALEEQEDPAPARVALAPALLLEGLQRLDGPRPVAIPGVPLAGGEGTVDGPIHRAGRCTTANTDAHTHGEQPGGRRGRNQRHVDLRPRYEPGRRPRHEGAEPPDATRFPPRARLRRSTSVIRSGAGLNMI
jgi:hypothetical protein